MDDYDNANANANDNERKMSRNAPAEAGSTKADLRPLRSSFVYFRLDFERVVVSSFSCGRIDCAGAVSVGTVDAFAGWAP